jgi:hypothetical protein
MIPYSQDIACSGSYNHHPRVWLSAGARSIYATGNGRSILEKRELVWFYTCGIKPDRIIASTA